MRAYIRRQYRKRPGLIMFLATILLSIASTFLLNYIVRYKEILMVVQSIKFDQDKIREFQISDPVLTYYMEQKKDKKERIEELTIHMMLNNYELTSMKQTEDSKISRRYKDKIKNLKDYKTLYAFYMTMLDNIKYFPVPNDLTGKEKVMFDNSWGNKRTYGGNRTHEGCDIMTSNNVRGYFPVLSITDGVVENKGWLKLGGYRLGIRGKNGCYYYYAHLYSYADGIKEGDTVHAGQLLGFMGDTGYSDKEGTTGQFDVHLHMGMYVHLKGQELSINPYAILRYLEKHKLSYYF